MGYIIGTYALPLYIAVCRGTPYPRGCPYMCPVCVSPGSVETCGNVQDHDFRQAVTAAGTDCMAAMLVERWLSANVLIEHGR